MLNQALVRDGVDARAALFVLFVGAVALLIAPAANPTAVDGSARPSKDKELRALGCIGKLVVYAPNSSALLLGDDEGRAIQAPTRTGASLRREALVREGYVGAAKASVRPDITNRERSFPLSRKACVRVTVTPVSKGSVESGLIASAGVLVAAGRTMGRRMHGVDGTTNWRTDVRVATLRSWLLGEEKRSTHPEYFDHALRPMAVVTELVYLCESVLDGGDPPRSRDRVSLQRDVTVAFSQISPGFKRELQPELRHYLRGPIKRLKTLLDDRKAVTALLVASRRLLDRIGRAECAVAVWHDVDTALATGPSWTSAGFICCTCATSTS